MREIIFKAKRKNWKKLPKEKWWIEGAVLQSDNRAYIATSFVYGAEDEPLMVAAYEVIPETICQYTGLTDKNGTVIWENDILRGHGNDNDLSKAVFGEFNVIDAGTLRDVDKVIGWHTEVIETDALSKCEPFCLPMPLTDFYIEISELEVFGNIFDNPELLEVSK